jgi:hypothetical protein
MHTPSRSALYQLYQDTTGAIAVIMTAGMALLVTVILIAMNGSINGGNQSDLTAKLSMCSQGSAKEFASLYARVLSRSNEDSSEGLFPSTQGFANITNPQALFATAKPKLSEAIHDCLIRTGVGMTQDTLLSTQIDAMHLEKDAGEWVMRVHASTMAATSNGLTGDRLARTKTQVSIRLSLTAQPTFDPSDRGSSDADETGDDS